VLNRKIARVAEQAAHLLRRLCDDPRRKQAFPSEPNARAVARRLYANVRNVPIIARTAMLTLAGSPRTSPSRIRRNCSWFLTTTSFACFTARVSVLNISGLDQRHWRIPDAYGAFSRRITIFSARDADKTLAGFAFQELFGLDPRLNSERRWTHITTPSWKS